MKKITTIVGTRPEIIRLSEIIKRFDLHFDHRLIHTGQNPDPNLKDVFFKDLGVREPDAYFGSDHDSLGTFIANLFTQMEQEFKRNRPDAVLILGDTNSALSAILAKRLSIPVYHLEAGNRSFDQNVPEEINRKIVDHTSDFNLVYTEHARNNLLSEGLHPRNTLLIGSPMREVLNAQRDAINSSKVLEELSLKPGQYVLTSMHRQENVDFPDRLETLISSLSAVHQKMNLPVLISTHPRTRKNLVEAQLRMEGLNFHTPFGFHDYIHLQENSRVVLSDSGTISEEASILGFPAVTIRESMERPEALEGGNIVMSGIKKDSILEAIELVLASGLSQNKPTAYAISDTSVRVINIIQSTLDQYSFWNGIRVLK